jgi:hypothetical protein
MPHDFPVCRMHMVLRALGVMQCAVPAHGNPIQQAAAQQPGILK